jgi:hypothetical protein
MKGDSLLVLAAALDQGSGRRDSIGEDCTPYMYEVPPYCHCRRNLFMGYNVTPRSTTVRTVAGGLVPAPQRYSFVPLVWLGRDIPTGSHESYATFGSVN